MKTHGNWAPWLVFLGCCVLSFVGYGLIVNTPGLYFTALAEEFGVARASVSLSVTIRALVGAATMLVAGSIMKKVDSRILLSGCVIVVAACFLSCSMLTQIWQFYVVFAIMGVAFVAPVMLAPSVLISNWFNEKLGLAMGIALGLSGIGGAVAQPIVAALISSYGWRSSYRISAIILLVCLLPFTVLFLKWAPRSERGESAYGTKVEQKTVAVHGIDAKNAYTKPTFILIVCAMVLLQFVGGIVQHVSSYEVSKGLTLEQGATVVTGIMLGAAVGKATIGMLLDRFKAHIVIIAYVAIAVVGWIGVAVLGIPALAAAAGFLSGIGQGYLLVALPWMIRQSFGPKDYSKILAIAMMFSNITAAVAVTLHGSIFDITGSYDTSFIIAIIAYPVATICGLAAYRLRPLKEQQ